ncbi:MAG: glutamate racemase [Bacteroidia bacterium]
MAAPIGVFDSGYGGLSILKELVKELPEYDYLYLGDNARAPYGTRSFDTVYHYTLECVQHLFNEGCELVILACNTASAKALRTIQQKDLPKIAPNKRVLGVIRPTTEMVGKLSTTKTVGILGTSGTVQSESYVVEIHKFFPDINVVQEACPMWVPLVENNEHKGDGADYFIKKHLDQILKKGPETDTLVLGCTHYPLLLDKIKKYLPPHIKVLAQGEIIAHSLKDYLQRHPEIESKCGKSGKLRFLTTDDNLIFDKMASIFFEREIVSEHCVI